jgi:hypothetical protein
MNWEGSILSDLDNLGWVFIYQGHWRSDQKARFEMTIMQGLLQSVAIEILARWFHLSGKVFPLSRFTPALQHDHHSSHWTYGWNHRGINLKRYGNETNITVLYAGSWAGHNFPGESLFVGFFRLTSVNTRSIWEKVTDFTEQRDRAASKVLHFLSLLTLDTLKDV